MSNCFYRDLIALCFSASLSPICTQMHASHGNSYSDLVLQAYLCNFLPTAGHLPLKLTK